MKEQTISPPENLPDAVVIKKILAGEKELFELIIRRYNQRLFRIGMSLLNNDVETEDTMQTAYINAYEHLGQFENRASFGTWLTRIMLNECLAQKKKKQHFCTDADAQFKNHTSMETPDYILSNKELSAVLEASVARLPEKYRLVFVLREIEEMSVKETSETLGIEQSNVKVRLNRAKTMLRDSLNGYMKDHVYNFHLIRCDRIVASVMTRLQLL